MSNESYPHSNAHSPSHDVDNSCASEPIPPPAACEPSPPSAQKSDAGVKLDILPNIDVKADVDAVGTDVSANVSADTSSGTGDDASSGIDIDVALATPDLGGGIPLDIGGLLGGGEEEGGHPLISLDSESEAVVNVPVFGDHGLLGGSTDLTGIVDGSQDIGSLLTAAMLDVGGDDGCLGALISADVYDGNVPLASDLSSALGSTLDLLTTTSSLFDVPTLDVLGCDGLDG